jgi:hypothetical protein
MKITLRPTTQFHQIAVAEPGDRPYARLWTGYTATGDVVQALIFGIALQDPENCESIDLVSDAEAPGPHIKELFPICIIASRAPGLPAAKEDIN